MDPDPTSPERYRLHGLLGRGAMGSVYEATQVDLARPVAMKFFDPRRDYDEVALARFFREATMLARLVHPGIVRIYDSGVLENRPYLVMERVEGTTLLSRTKSETPTPLPRALDLTLELLDVLQFLADHDVVHRDIKPANIFETSLGALKLGDFGLARPLSPQFSLTGADTAQGSILGTPAYMAPEIFMGAPASAATDLYAAGIVLYELVAGRRPWGEKLSNSPGIPLRDLVPEAPRALEDLLGEWLEANVQRRLVDRDEIRRRLLAVRAEASHSVMEVTNPVRPGAVAPGVPETSAPAPSPRPVLPVVAALVGTLAVALAIGAASSPMSGPIVRPSGSPGAPLASQVAEMQGLIARLDGITGIGLFDPSGVDEAGEALMRSELDRLRAICDRRLPQIASDQRVLAELEERCGDVTRWDPSLHTTHRGVTARIGAQRFVLWSVRCRLEQLARLAEKDARTSGNGIIDFAGNLSRHHSVRYGAEGVGLVLSALEKIAVAIPELAVPAEGRAWRLRYIVRNLRRIGDYLVAVPWPEAARPRMAGIVEKFEAGLTGAGDEDLARVRRIVKFYWDLGYRGSTTPSLEEARWAAHRDLSVIQSQSPPGDRPVIEPLIRSLQASLEGRSPVRGSKPPRFEVPGQRP